MRASKHIMKMRDVSGREVGDIAIYMMRGNKAGMRLSGRTWKIAVLEGWGRTR